jgi:hypothetical protein
VGEEEKKEEEKEERKEEKEKEKKKEEEEEEEKKKKKKKVNRGTNQALWYMDSEHTVVYLKISETDHTSLRPSSHL